MNEQMATIKFDTSLISIFLNRCHLSFKQMMFENLAQLKLAMNKFIKGQSDYEYPHAPILYEKWIQDSANQIETCTTASSTEDQLNKIEAFTRDAIRNKSYHMKHLLTSLVHTFGKNDQRAVADLHRYFDYQMRSKVTKPNTETGAIEFVSWAVKVHHPALNLAGLRFRLG